MLPATIQNAESTGIREVDVRSTCVSSTLMRMRRGGNPLGNINPKRAGSGEAIETSGAVGRLIVLTKV